MKLSFLPGKLFLDSADGIFRVTLDGKEVLSTRSQRAAVSKFNALKKELEQLSPQREDTPAEKAEALQREMVESMLPHNSLGGRKKKTTAGGTRTFGG